MVKARAVNPAHSMTYWWEENIEARLMDQGSLSQMFPYMCKITAEDPGSSRHDPITSTAITFLTCPVQLGLTEVGATLFQGRSSLVYPYNLMSDSQKDFVREALSRREEWNIYNDAVVFRRSQPRQQAQPQPAQKNQKSLQAQQGGAPPPRTQAQQHSPPTARTLAPAAVLVALCSKVFESSAHPDPRRRVALCNIILQRVQGYIPIDKPVQRQLNEWLAGKTMGEQGPQADKQQGASPGISEEGAAPENNKR